MGGLVFYAGVNAAGMDVVAFRTFVLTASSEWPSPAGPDSSPVDPPPSPSPSRVLLYRVVRPCALNHQRPARFARVHVLQKRRNQRLGRHRQSFEGR
jgi:hypothetical protein